MKLSEAILAGCKIAPRQAYGGFFDDGYWFGKNPVEACALGAAYLACNTPSQRPLEIDATLTKEFPILIDPPSAAMEDLLHPFHRQTVKGVIVYLNDDEHLTREEIAALLAAEGL